MKRRSLFPCLTSFVLLLCCRAYGLDPKRAPAEYLLERWSAEQGFDGGAVYSIAQTPDGYLWIGCEAGLMRFNGIAFQPAPGSPALARPVQQLLADAEGNLWVRQQNMSLFRYRDGKVQDLLRGIAGPSDGATAMARGREGGVIFWVLAEGIWYCKRDELKTLYRDSSHIRSLLPLALAETSEHRLWIGSRDAGLLRLEKGTVVDYAASVPDLKVNVIFPETNGQLWIGTDGGARRWNGRRITSEGVPKELRKAQILSLNKDHEGNLWVGTHDALFRVTPDGRAEPVQPGRISGVNTIFEDRESNLWIGTEEGLARLRDSAFLSYPQSDQQRRSQENSPVYVDEQDRTWYSTSEGTVNWRRASDTGEIRIGGDDDTIYSISGQGADIWVGRKLGGLTHIRCVQACRVVRNYTEADGLPENAITSVFTAADGSVWAGTANSGVSRLQANRFTTFASPSALTSNSIRAIAQTPDGATWFGTSRGLTTEREGVWHTYDASDGVPPGAINCLNVDQEGILWIGASYGLAFIKDSRIRTVEWTSGLGEQVLGLAAGTPDSLWIANPKHILQVKRAAALNGAIAPSDTREFGAYDGLLTGPVLRRSPTVTSDASGRIWLSTNRGLSVVDPTRLPAQAALALPHLQQISADGTDLKFSNQVDIPALRKRVVFNFVGLSLTAPQHVRYQYRLDNFDPEWSKPVSIREAVYTNLPPGTYRFRLRASNLAGVWGSQEDSVLVRVEPAFWQTWWFQAMALLLLGLCFVATYAQRVRAVKSRLNLRFNERLFERTRIAQELHDTLLQGFLSASMQLHVANNRLEEDSPAKAPLKRATELMRRAGDEGRAALRQLRSEEDTTSLEDAFSSIPREGLMKEDVGFRLRVEGHARPLRPVLRDDVYRISREAIVNAMRHSGAANIEVEVSYEPHQLRIVVQDDGCGIDAEVMKSGREGHWGIQGMRERAERIRAKLSLLSSSGRGTEFVLRVPGKLAYENAEQFTGIWPTALRSRLSSLMRQSSPEMYGQRKQNSNT